MDMGKTDKHPLAYKIVDHQMERGTLTPHDLISKFGVEAPKAHQIAGYISNDPYEKRVSKISNILNSNTSQFSYDMGRNKDRMVVNKSTEDGVSEHIPTHLKQLQTKADAYHKAGDTGMVKISDEEHAKGTPYYKPTQKTEVEDLSRSETRLAILAKGLKAAITLRGLIKAEKRIDHDKEAGLTTLDKTPSGHVKVANGHAKAGDYLDYFGTRHKVLGVSKDKRTVTTAPVTSPKGEEPTVKEHLKESHPYYYFSPHRLITSDEVKNGVSKEKGYSIKSSGGGNK